MEISSPFVSLACCCASVVYKVVTDVSMQQARFLLHGFVSGQSKTVLPEPCSGSLA